MTTTLPTTAASASWMEYELTAFGRTLEPVLLSMRSWGEAFQRRDAQARESSP